MPVRIRAVRDLDEFRAAESCIGHYFGWEPSVEDGEEFSRLLPLERTFVAVDGADIVAAAGAFPLQLTVPGGVVPCSGITVVGTLPSHRRRGLARRLMEAQLRDTHERGEPVSALWASEETIYGRYGYGMASLCLQLQAQRGARIPRHTGSLDRAARVRLVGHEEALRTFPRVYERIRRRRPGFLARNRDWWEIKQLGDRPHQRRGGGPLHRALLERDGRPAGFALYRVVSEGSGADWRKTVRVREAFGLDLEATREIWRYLLQIDWVDEVEAWLLPVDHPLLLLVDRVNLLRPRTWDGLWVRLLDVGAALAARGYAGDARVTVEVVSDPQFPDNVGRWTVEHGSVRRSRRRPDISLDVQALAAAYLGGFSFAQLARAGRVEETSRGGAARADALFCVEAAPWCPENF